VTLANPIERVKDGHTAALIYWHQRDYEIVGFDKATNEWLLAPKSRLARA
jgi:hypothetical protein